MSMKSIYVTFEDEQIKELEKKKGNLSWKKAILQWAKVKHVLTKR